jgi:hypothetical protein
VWKNISNKSLSSKIRSKCYILANKKLPLKQTIFNQQRIASPNWPNCNNHAEDLLYKYTGCFHSRDLWTYMQDSFRRKTGLLVCFKMLAYPELLNIRPDVKVSLMKMFAVYLNFIESVSVNRIDQ